MSEERTEAATPKRRNEQRKKGAISKSQDFNSAAMLAIGMVLLSMQMPFIMDRLRFVTVYDFTHLHPSLITPDNIESIFAPYFNTMAQITLPFLVLLMVSGIIIVRAQVGHLFTLEPLKPSMEKLSPMKMFGNLKNTFNIFSPKKIVELLKSILKLVIVGMFAYSVINSRKQELFALLGADITTAFSTMASIIGQLVTNMCMVMLVLGIIDKKYQDYEFEKSIKMTKQEIKDERKNSDGDPFIKGQIKSKQMKLAQQRMMSEIPKANVVITNPTHYAIAIRYDINVAPAPQVIAKGVDFVAFKIREVAENNNIPIIENKPLARTLYKIVPLEGLIPPELYTAVAEVLAYVYKLNQRR